MVDSKKNYKFDLGVKGLTYGCTCPFFKALIDVMPHNYITCCSVFHFKSVMSSWYMLKLSFVFSPKNNWMIFIQSLSAVQLYRIQGGSMYYPPLLNNFILKKVFIIFRTPISLNRRNCGWVGGALISKCDDPTGFKLSTRLLIKCSHLPQVWLLSISLYSSQLVYLLLVQNLKHYVYL